MNLLQKLIAYQQQRFPVLILSLTMISVLYSTWQAVGQQGDWLTWLLLYVSALSFLLHVRIIDENRDKDIDDAHHPDRPIQSGLISLQELNRIGYANGAIFFLIHLYLDPLAGLLSFLLLMYSLLGRYEFFLGERFKSGFWIYNLVNTVQLILLQLVAYSVFLSPSAWGRVQIWHAAGIFLLSLLIEVGRKTYPAALESSTNDTYSSRMGFLPAIGLALALALAAILAFGQVFGLVYGGLTAGLLAFLALAAWYLARRDDKRQKMYQLGVVLAYVAINFSVYAR